MLSTSVVGFFGSLLVSLPTAYAGFNSGSSSGVAVYWGQNSYGQGTGSLAQQRLSYYCANTQVDIIPLAFLTTISNPSLNFANAGDKCTTISGSNLFYCSELEQDITTCQTTYGKTILLSIGGATYTEGGFSTTTAAVAAANNIWSIFGPKTSANVPRPFGSAVINGFDFDFESTVSNMPAFAAQLRSLMTASSGGPYLLTAAPQCPYPDVADNPMLNGAIAFDAIFVQFYNNYCGIQSFVPGASTQNNFNFQTWDNWAQTVSKNPNVKIFLGIPGNSGAGAGYQTGSALASVVAFSKGFKSFGGVMIWDMSQVFANSGFLNGVVSDVGKAATTTVGSGPTTTTTKATSTPTTLTTVTRTTTTGPSTTGVAQYNQCGGTGYTGPTVCQSPFICTEISVWWSQCD